MSSNEAPFKGPPTHGLNIVPFAIMAGGWLGPLMMFWLYVWGPLRPFSYPEGDLLPHATFIFVIFACVALWWCLPRGYFRVHAFERTGRLYEYLGVGIFRWFVPDGVLVNRWERRKDPSYRVIRSRQSAAEFVDRTEQSERGHIVLMAVGFATAIFAWRIGWYGWAAYLSAGNILVNLYPVLLQRYTRSRIDAMLNRSPRILR